jgi:hypothetical protein
MEKVSSFIQPPDERFEYGRIDGANELHSGIMSLEPTHVCLDGIHFVEFHPYRLVEPRSFDEFEAAATR